MTENYIETIAGVKMPMIIYGTAWKKEQSAELVKKAIQSGFRGLDTACQPKHYNEAGVGEAVQDLARQGLARESLFIQTKFTPLSGQDPERLPYDQNAPLASQVMQSFESSQKNLATSYVDSLVLHAPLARYQDLMQVWRSMEAIAKQGGARQLGISNCYSVDLLKQLFQDAEVKPAVLQNRFYRDSNYDHSIRAWCRSQGIIYQSFWTLTANPHILQSQVMQEIASSLQKTEAQVFFRFLTQIGIVPLTGTSSEKHMKEDLEIFQFELASETIAKIEKLLL